jgi:isoleucyl-tRNA synthetase
MDKWIIILLNQATSRITAFMEEYNISKAVRLVLDIIEDITNWYIKFNRDRFKGKYGLLDWQVSLSVLFQVIRKYTVLLAPFAPFLATWSYDTLISIIVASTNETTSNSNVFLENYSDMIQLDITVDEKKECLDTFELLQRIARMVRGARTRTTTHTSNKTPIKTCNICMDSPQELDLISKCIDLIQSELNVIDISYKPLTGNINYKLIANKSILGKKYRQHAKLITTIIELTNADKIDINGNLEIIINGRDGIDGIDGRDKYIITKDEYMLEPQFGQGDIYDNTTRTGILIQLDFTYDQTIENMAILKRFIADIQQNRKHLGLRPWNKILVEITHDDFNIIKSNLEYIQLRLECDVSDTSKHTSNDIFQFIPFQNEQSTTITDNKYNLCDHDRIENDTSDARMIIYQIIK